MKILCLTDAVLSNLKEFLARTSLKGGEVPAFVEVLNAVNSAKEENEEDGK